MNRVVITGYGVVTSNGDNREEFAEALYEGISGLKEVSIFDMSKMRTKLGGQVNFELKKVEQIDDEERTVQMAKKALKEAFTHAGIDSEYIMKLDNRCGLSISTSLAGNERMMKYLNEKSDGYKGNPEWLVKIPTFLYSILRETKVKGPCYTTMSACAAGTAGVGVAYDLISKGKVDLVVTGGADPLTEFACTGFHALKSLSPTGCKPFDKNHDGIVIGEGSAFFILESLDNAIKRGAKIYAEILGYSINNEAYHITSPNPTGVGAYRSMSEALNRAKVAPKDVDYINAHGTATKANDEMELKAIELLLGDKAKEIPISSIKSMVGHCLGAAGSIELASCLIALEKGFIPATETLKDHQDGYEDFNLIKTATICKDLDIILSNSFAFAGNTSSIVIGRYKDNIRLDNN